MFFVLDVPIFVAIAGMADEQETENPSLGFKNGNDTLTVTSDGLYNMAEIPLDSSYYIRQSDESNISPAFICEGPAQNGTASPPQIMALLYCSWHSNFSFKQENVKAKVIFYFKFRNFMTILTETSAKNRTNTVAKNIEC